MSVPAPKPTALLHETLQRNLNELAEDQEANDWECNLQRLEDLALTDQLTEEHLTEDLRADFAQCRLVSHYDLAYSIQSCCRFIGSSARPC